jgi:hypothetical protein
MASYWVKEYQETSVWKWEWTVYKVKLSDVIDFHTRVHGGQKPSTNVCLSDDGVPVARCSGTSFDVVSLKFEG